MNLQFLYFSLSIEKFSGGWTFFFQARMNYFFFGPQSSFAPIREGDDTWIFFFFILLRTECRCFRHCAVWIGGRRVDSASRTIHRIIGSARGNYVYGSSRGLRLSSDSRGDPLCEAAEICVPNIFRGTRDGAPRLLHPEESARV